MTPSLPGLDQARAVVTFWTALGPEGWFTKDDAVDRRFREQFHDLHFAAAAGQCAHWLADATGGLALLLLLDQYPRNAFRGTGHMFATDGLARHYARLYIASGLVDEIPAPLRLFACLPFVHSENIEDQNTAQQLYPRYAPQQLDWAQHHQRIIVRFGRFPHRNASLGRDTTPEEQAYLDNDGFKG